MQIPITHQLDEIAEHAPCYLDQFLESRDHANQWDVSAFWQETATASTVLTSTSSVGNQD
jgi:hypothetical protein